MYRTKFLFNLAMFVSVFVLLFYLFSVIDNAKLTSVRLQPRMKFIGAPATTLSEKVIKLDNDYNLWLIFTKVVDKSPLMYNFNHLLLNLIRVSSVPLFFHIIIDDGSKQIAIDEIVKVSKVSGIVIHYAFYNVSVFASAIQDVVDAMTPFFSSRPGTYYSDALFYLSIGLYRLAPVSQKQAIMIDCDVYFKKDIKLLFDEFKSFNEYHLFGLAPELSPVYKHILYTYKQKHNTTFGEFYHPQMIDNGVHPRGFQGYNSGVILFNFSAIRNSDEYKNVISKKSVGEMVDKYNFRGHLGDQDFYTLLGFEKPHMIRTLHCGFNRQLCTWWGDKGGYKDIFDNYFKCKHKIVVLHGNCNTKLPV